MTEVFRGLIDHPAAWTGESLGAREGLVREIPVAELKAIDRILTETADKPPQTVTRAEFSAPALDGFLVDVLAEVMRGKGAVIVRGLTRACYTDEQMERVYWGFGTHWGNAVVQTVQGDRLGRVHAKPDAGHTYQTNEELAFHTDTHEIVGLMCLQKAVSGGFSEIVSALAIHNEIFRTRPELLDPLYRGYPYAFRYTTQPRHMTSYSVPVFSCVDGDVSTVYVRGSIARASEYLGTPLPDDLAAGIGYFNAIAVRPEMKLRFMLEPGEMLVFNNFTVLHSRTTFEDTDDQRRYLLRMWLDTPHGRPVIAEYERYIKDHHLARLAYDEKHLLV